MPVETILVSGASGTVGSEVVRYLFSSTDVNFKAAARSVEKIKTCVPILQLNSDSY